VSLQEYRCRKCNWWLFSSDAEAGRVEVTCKNRRCECRQTVYLGGRLTKRPALAIVQG
jgi:hypothetical protein